MYSKLFLSIRILISVFLFSHISGCTITDIGEDPFTEFSNFTLGDEKIEFKSAKLTITGPINFSSSGSHVLAKLDLSTDENFAQPYIPNSSVMTINIYSAANGKSLPDFPLKDGEYRVFPAEGIPDAEVIPTLEGENFSTGPLIGSNYFQEEFAFQSLHDAKEGKISIIFDFEKNMVKITHNWVTKDGVKANGSNNLPLNLSSFNP
jgi:hypothetical protein